MVHNDAKMGRSAMSESLEKYQNFVPKGDFRTAYSNLVRAVWKQPNLAAAIQSKPSALSEFGFTKIPKAVQLVTAVGIPTIDGYDNMMREFHSDVQEVVTLVSPTPTRGLMTRHAAELARSRGCRRSRS